MAMHETSGAPGTPGTSETSGTPGTSGTSGSPGSPEGAIIGLGTDIVEIRRIREAYERHASRFAQRILTPRELGRLRLLRDPVPYLAGRFAAKESILKVLGTGLAEGIGWRQLHVVREPSGAPTVFLSGPALDRARRLGLGRILVSIAHGRDHAVAQSIGLAGDPERLRIEGD